ncbi:MAG: DUF4249 domain-containing protein [Carboxylicivirga sp.]|jgi:hypothetical protein|nr:DUF4249 domain-containing protein [Carboxylicivirga sp.]
MIRKTICFFLTLLSLSSCLETYDVNIKDYKDLLVVDALITDEVKDHRIYLSRSVPNLNETPQPEAGALVVITDEYGNEEVLNEVEPGVYETDHLQFVAKVGGTYILSIRTAGGQEYKSTPCTILPQSKIDKIHYKAGKEWNKDETAENYGLHILVDGSSEKDGYVRWLYDEDWKFRVPYPTHLVYDYQIKNWVSIRPTNVTCWKSSVSNSIVIHSFANQSSADLKDKIVCFVPSEITDKLTVRYSVLVKQLSISKEEYEFWNKLQISTAEVGNVFGTQPFSISGNIQNVSNDKEPVLGYFQTGSVSSKRIYINRSVADNFGLPLRSYKEGCRVDTFLADGQPFESTYDIYKELVLSGSMKVHDGVYGEFTNAVIGLLLTSGVCSDCTVSGEAQKPDFWED